MLQNRSYNILFVLLLLASAVFTLPYHHGFQTGDCASYLKASDALIHGHWNVSGNYYANRIGTYLPYAIAMYFFGLTKWLTLITTAEFLLLLTLVYLIVRKHDSSVAFIAAAMLGLSMVMRSNAGVVMGDIAATLTANAVVLCYFLFTFYIADKAKRSIRWGIATVLIFVASFLTKESVAFFVPLLIYFYWADRHKPEAKNYWRTIIALVIVGVIAFIVVYWIKTGNPLYRIQALDAGPSASDSNYIRAAWGTILSRITWQPLQMLVEDYTFGYLFLLSMLQVICCRSDSPAQERFFKIYFLGTISVWWLGSQTLTHYNPVALVLRIWLPLLVPMAINSAFFIMHLMRGDLNDKAQKSVTAVIIIFMPVYCVLLYFSYVKYVSLGIHPPDLVNNALLYMIVSASILLSIYTGYIAEVLPLVRQLIFLIIVILPSYGSYGMLKWDISLRQNHIEDRYDHERDMMLYTYHLNPRRIITDSWAMQAYNIYIGYETQLNIVDYNDIDTLSEGDYLLLNKGMQSGLIKNITDAGIFMTGKYKVSDIALHPEQHGFVFIKENETNLLYRYSPSSQK